jgi:hypothetical protein
MLVLITILIQIEMYKSLYPTINNEKSDKWFSNHQSKIKRDISPDGTQHVDVGKTSVTKADTIDEIYVDGNSNADKNKDIWFSVCVERHQLREASVWHVATGFIAPIASYIS